MLQIKGGDEKGKVTAITKLLLFRYPDIFCICLIKQKFFIWSKNTFYLLPPSLFTRFLIDMISISFKMRKKGKGHKKQGQKVVHKNVS